MITGTNALAPSITIGGLSIHTNSGVLFINGSETTIAAADTALTANSTNYIYVNLTTGLLAVNTSGFPAFSYPIATVVTGPSGVSSVTDNRADVVGSSAATGVVTSGLLAEYRILPTETPGALVDYSGNGNNATGTVGTAPTIVATTGGLNFTGNGAVSLPAALNSARTVQLFVSIQGSAQTHS